MAIRYCGHRVTPTELAKLVVEDKGRVGTEYWGENESIDHDAMTAREVGLVDAAMASQVERVRRFLKFDKCLDRVYSN